MRRVAVQDANILIDLFEAGLLQELFELDIEMHTTDLVLSEVLHEEQATAFDRLAKTGQLRVHPLPAIELAEVVATKQNANKRLSLADCSAWYLAEHLKATLLTGDGALRKIAEKAGLEVHGALWLLDEILTAELIGSSQACIALRLLMSRNPRLPEKECFERLERWCGEE